MVRKKNFAHRHGAFHQGLFPRVHCHVRVVVYNLTPQTQGELAIWRVPVDLGEVVTEKTNKMVAMAFQRYDKSDKMIGRNA